MLTAQKKMGLIFFPAFDWAISPTHPEREERLLYTQDQIWEEGLLDIEGIHEFRPDIATEQDVQRVHFCVPDVAAQTTESHLISAGGTLKAAQIVLEKKVDCAFALVRPPGHHSMRVVHGNRGFCNINIEAVMIEYIRDVYGKKKIAIVDTDCHHGDGTEDIYWHDPDTLFISIHQDGRTLYPGTGFPDEMGGPNAFGYNINIPLPPYTTDEGYLMVLEKLVLPVLEEFQPELIINSAGQDNHYSDPITNMMISARGYAELNKRLNPDIAVLEGGYSIEGALPYVNTGIILAMAGMDFSHVKEPDYDEGQLRLQPEVKKYIENLSQQIYELWTIKDRVREGLRKGKSWIERPRRIFYDTDGIDERQKERVKLCKNCKGILTIESSSDRGNRIFAVHIPSGACAVCEKEGRDLFAKASKKEFGHIYLQDRKEKVFETR